MVLVEIADSTTVTDYKVLESPFIAEDLLEQTGGSAAGIIVETLVSTHHLTDVGILNECLKGRHIGLPEIANRYIGEVGGVTCVLRTAVNGIMLGTGPELSILGILRSLQTAYHLSTHDGGQIGILAVGLLTTPPTGIAEDVDVGCPYAEATHLHVLTLQVIHAVVVLGTELRTGNVEHLI